MDFLFFCVKFSRYKFLKVEPSKLNINLANVRRLVVRNIFMLHVLHRKEVIQPHLPIRLPCYDFTPIIGPTVDGCPIAVGSPASGKTDFRGVTGGVYKARERIHRSMLTCDY